MEIDLQYPAANLSQKDVMMADHEHGTMNTEVQEKTYAGFLKASTYVAAASISVIVLALMFFG